MPQFTSPDGWSSTTQMLALGGLHLLNIAVVYTTVGLLARRLLRTAHARARWSPASPASAMTVIGVGILIEQVFEWL